MKVLQSVLSAVRQTDNLQSVFVFSQIWYWLPSDQMPLLITNMQPEANRNFWHHQAIVKIESNDKILGSMMQIVRVISRDKELGELEKFDGFG